MSNLRNRLDRLERRRADAGMGAPPPMPLEFFGLLDGTLSREDVDDDTLRRINEHLAIADFEARFPDGKVPDTVAERIRLTLDYVASFRGRPLPPVPADIEPRMRLMRAHLDGQSVGQDGPDAADAR